MSTKLFFTKILVKHNNYWYCHESPAKDREKANENIDQIREVSSPYKLKDKMDKTRTKPCKHTHDSWQINRSMFMNSNSIPNNPQWTFLVSTRAGHKLNRSILLWLTQRFKARKLIIMLTCDLVSDRAFCVSESLTRITVGENYKLEYRIDEPSFLMC